MAEVTGYGLQWIRVIARRFNEGVVVAIGDSRHRNPGAKPLLNDWQQAQLVQALEGPARVGGKWNGPFVAAWMSELLGRPVAPQRGWEYLKGLDYSIKVPRPAHTQADELELQQWKKKLPQQLIELEASVGGAPIRVWAMDSHQVGLKPLVYQDWFPW